MQRPRVPAGAGSNGGGSGDQLGSEIAAFITPTGSTGKPANAIPGFDYTVLPADTADTLRQSATAIRTIQRSAFADVASHLTAAKELLEHGAFSAWVKAELGMTLRSAERYMQAAQFVAGKSDTVSLLPPTLIYALAAPSAPAEAVKQIVGEIEAGATLAPKEIKRKLADAIEAERKVIEAERIAKIEAAETPEQIKKARKARETKAARDARKAAEHRAYQEKQQREEQERAKRLRPLAERILTLGSGDVRALVNVLIHYADRTTLLGLLRDATTIRVAT
jgi:hypothetical protein